MGDRIYATPGGLTYVITLAQMRGQLPPEAGEALANETVRLRGLLDAVLALHSPITEYTYGSTSAGVNIGDPTLQPRQPVSQWTRCSHGCNPLIWPCATRAAAAEEAS